ncbi:helix-turn-helix domain-containing protein [Streptomyces sp. NPDC091292]|uniref:helix-turn-helix domain-containing protein n=1 Tax=Streptomyces sp. NPDC091292 TaxID=3365991 RepID=UPI00380BC1CC
MPAGGKPTVRSRRLGAALKRHREAAGMGQEAGAEAIMKSVTKVSRMENGQVSASALEVRTLLACYGVTDPDERARLEGWARASNERGWWLDYQETLRPDYADHITLESDATCIRTWEPALIPGLLQTPEYAESVITVGPTAIPAQRVRELVKVRQERQRRIESGGTQFEAIIWEPAIRALSEGVVGHVGQLEHLLTVGQRSNVTLQIVPHAESVVAGMSGPFVAFSFGDDPTIEAVTFNNPASTSVIESPEELALYSSIFSQLRSVAMSPGESMDQIRAMLDGDPQNTKEAS